MKVHLEHYNLDKRLHTEVLQEKYGTIDVQVLCDDDNKREVLLMDKNLVARTYALTLKKHDWNPDHLTEACSNGLSMIATRSVRERLAIQLIVLREKYKENFEPGTIVEINIGRDDLASLVGTARENVVRVLTEFKEEGILTTQGRKIVVHDVDKLLRIGNF